MKFHVLSIVAALALVSPAAAKDITITLNDQEQTALAQVLDQATRSGGLAATQGTVYFYNKLQQAITAANAPPPAEPAKASEPAEPAK